jgi:phosphoribosyl 1,2-cyclic phosphodiesterase
MTQPPHATRIRVLRSGSSGNALLVEGGGTAVLVDAGVPAETLVREMAAATLPAPSAILLTHEHEDHARGAAALARLMSIPIYANEGTIRAAGQGLAGAPVERFVTGEPFRIGALAIEPFPVPHDALEPVGFVVTQNGTRTFIATDLGEITGEVLAAAGSADTLLVEANYDLALLNVSPYPWFLKNRIVSATGHLSNDGAARLAVHAAARRAGAIFLIHLSDINNLRSLARDTVQWALAAEGLEGPRIEAVRANGASPVWTV